MFYGISALDNRWTFTPSDAPVYIMREATVIGTPRGEVSYTGAGFPVGEHQARGAHRAVARAAYPPADTPYVCPRDLRTVTVRRMPEADRQAWIAATATEVARLGLDRHVTR